MLCNDSVCTQHALAMTLLADGNFEYNDTLSTQTTMFDRFVSNVSPTAGWDTSRGASFLGFMDTLSYDLISNDANISFVSDYGRTSLLADTPPPAAGVPEPGPLGLAFVALIGFVFVPRRRAAKAQPN